MKDFFTIEDLLLAIPFWELREMDIRLFVRKEKNTSVELTEKQILEEKLINLEITPEEFEVEMNKLK